MSKNGRGILKIADYFRPTLNPCEDCDGTGRDKFDGGTCLHCDGKKRAKPVVTGREVRKWQT